IQTDAWGPMTGRTLAAVAALGLAVLLGVSDSPNARAALVAARAGSYPVVVAWSVIWHLAGGLVAGVAVARTVAELVRVQPNLLAPALAAGCVASIIFTLAATRRGIPASASVGLVGGLAGAGLVAGGWHGVDWGGVRGLHFAGVIGVLAGLVLAPLFGGVAAGAANRGARRVSYRLGRSSVRPLRAGVWAASAAVGFADGSNDGQKAMGVLAVAASGSAVWGVHGLVIPWWDRVACASLLVATSALGGRRVVLKVARGLSRTGPVDALAAETASATVILLAGTAGLPLSTSSVVTSAMVGTGAVRRRRHVRWKGVLAIFGVWAITVPACALLGAGLMGLWRAFGI
ncbi:MAG: inorganic phosphate transporter, partial [Acidimicrobiales bacterium]